MKSAVRMLGVVAFMGASVLARPALAEDDGDEPLRHGDKSWELGLSTGFAQAAGLLRQYGDETVVTTGPGAAFALDLGYRANPAVSVGPRAAFEMYAPMEAWYPAAEEERIARGLSLGLDVDIYPSPRGLVSPWLGLGIGYRLLWVPQPAHEMALEHGPQLFRLNGGLDFVVADGLALGPWAGADLTLITWRENDTIETGAPVFFQAGLRGVLNFESMGAESARPVRVAR